MKRTSCKYFYKRVLLPLFSLLLLSVLTSFFTPVSAANSDYPYPSLLDYSDLESSFNTLARDKISSPYQNYILTAIKYHIESSTGNYRVAKNLLQQYNSVDGNVIFFFDGCSVNLDGATPTFSGYLKGGSRYNTSAVCIAVRANDQGKPYIVFASANASTMADNVRNASLNSGTPVSITIDGIYNISAVNHQGKYAGMNINTFSNTGVRCSTDGVSYLSMGTGINIHSKGYSYPYLTNSTRSSTGCFNVGRTYGDAEYNEFILKTTGMSNAINNKFSSSPTSFGIANGSIIGITIVDRSNYISGLQTIYGNDSASGGWSKEKIASEITKNSASWHSDIEEIIASHTCIYSVVEHESAHPHREYVKCECGAIGGYTGVMSSVSSCPSCNVSCSCLDSYAGTYICTTSSSPLNIRSGHGTGYGVVGSIPIGAKVTVTKATSSWAHVTYNGVSGYASMDYLSRVSSPVISGITHTPSYIKAGNAVTFTLNATEATGYELSIYSETELLLNTGKISANKLSYTFKKEGTYYIAGSAYNGDAVSTAPAVCVTVNPADVFVSVSFSGKLSAFMDTLYIRYYFVTDATENVDRMGTLLMKADDFEQGGYSELTLDNATTNLIADNSENDQYSHLGNFALQTVYAKDINVVYKVRPYVILKNGSVFYGETEEYGMGIYLNNQISKPFSTDVYKKVLSALLNYGKSMETYANR